MNSITSKYKYKLIYIFNFLIIWNMHIVSSYVNKISFYHASGDSQLW